MSLPMRPLDTTTAACSSDAVPACTLAMTGTDANYTASRIVCVVSPGVGAGFQILIRDTWTGLVVNGLRAGFNRPTVTGVVPAVLPPAGGEVTVSGSGFGLGPCGDVNRTSDVQVVGLAGFFET